MDKPSASIATDETLVSQRSSNLLLFTRNLNAKHYNSEFRIHNSELSDAHKVSLREQGKQTLRLDKVNQILNLFGAEVGAVPMNKSDE